MNVFSQSDKLTQEKAWATQLSTALNKAVPNFHTSSIDGWAREFPKLRKTFTDQEIQAVLDWYCEHIDEEFIPRIRNSSAFVIRFGDIKHAMNRADVNHISPFAVRTAARMVNLYTWPVEIIPHMPSIVEVSTANFRAFATKLKIILPGHEHEAFLAHVMWKYAPCFVITEWLPYWNDQVKHLEHYNGSPMNLSFEARSVRFRDSFWRQWSWKWCGNPNKYDKLLEAIISE